MSEDNFGRPGARALDRQRRYSRNPLRCHPTTVAPWLHQHHCVQGLRPNPVEPHPEQLICGEQLNPAFVLALQDGDLMPKSDEFKFQAGAAPKAECGYPAQRGHRFQRKADSIPVIADSR